MLVYWVMFLIPAAIAVVPLRMSSALQKVIWGMLGCFYTVVIGFRYEIGGDWWGYGKAFLKSTAFPLQALTSGSNEYGYEFLNRLFSHAALPIWTVNTVCAAIVVSGVLALAWRQSQPFLALAVSVPYVLIVVSMGYTRQSAALGLICWAFIAIEERKQTRFFVLVLLASLMHSSALLVAPFAWYLQSPAGRRFFLLFALPVLGFALVLLWDFLLVKFQNYSAPMVSHGALPRILLGGIAAVTLLLNKERLQIKGDRAFWAALAWLAIMFFPLVFINSTGSDRLALYCLPLQMVVFGNAGLLFESKPLRSLAGRGVLILYASMLLVWLNFSVVRQWWVPYRFFPVPRLLILPDRYINQGTHWNNDMRQFGGSCYIMRQLPYGYAAGYSLSPLRIPMELGGK